MELSVLSDLVYHTPGNEHIILNTFGIFFFSFQFGVKHDVAEDREL